MAKSILIYCGSSKGHDSVYEEEAKKLVRALKKYDCKIIFGAGSVGLMGVLADEYLALGGEVIGVIPEALETAEVANRDCTQLHVVKDMHERKALMEQLSDAFVVLPGGFGTLDEACEILTWAQLGLHAKPLGLINTAGYYDLLTAFLDHAQGEDFISATNRRLVQVEATAAALLERLTAG